jgi:hypothetical protein
MGRQVVPQLLRAAADFIENPQPEPTREGSDDNA